MRDLKAQRSSYPLIRRGDRLEIRKIYFDALLKKYKLVFSYLAYVSASLTLP
jgi:hypothetical protein